MELRLKKRIVGSLILGATALIIVPLFFNHSVPSNTLQLSAEIPAQPAKPGNLALPIPPKNATDPTVAAKGNPVDKTGSPQSRIVFESLQSLGAAENTSPAPKLTVTTPQPQAMPPLIAAQKTVDIPQKTTLPITPPAINKASANADNAANTNPPPAQPASTNIEKLEQATMGSLAAATPKAVTPATPPASQSVSQPVGSHKKPTKSNTAQTAKAESPIKTKNTAPNPQSWAVQLGSFSDKLNAEKLMKKLQSEGFSAYTRTSKTAHGDLIRVLVGPELHRTDADDLLAKLQKELNLQGMVIKGA